MASCQQYESKPTLPQGQIVRVSCKAYPDRDMGVVDLKEIRLVRQSSNNPAQTWLKVEKGSNHFTLLQPSVVKSVGIAKDELALVDMNAVVTWENSIAIDEDGKVCSESEYVYISIPRPPNDEDGKVGREYVWTAEESCDGIKIKLRAKKPGNPNQLWKIENLIK